MLNTLLVVFWVFFSSLLLTNLWFLTIWHTKLVSVWKFCGFNFSCSWGSHQSVFFFFFFFVICFCFSFCLLLVTWHSVLIFGLFCFCFLPLRCPACCVSWHFYHQPLHGPPPLHGSVIARWPFGNPAPARTHQTARMSTMTDWASALSDQESVAVEAEGLPFHTVEGAWTFGATLLILARWWIRLFWYYFSCTLSWGAIFFFWESWEKGRPRNTASFLDPRLPRKNVFPGRAVPGKRPLSNDPIDWKPFTFLFWALFSESPPLPPTPAPLFWTPSCKRSPFLDSVPWKTPFSGPHPIK